MIIKNIVNCNLKLYTFTLISCIRHVLLRLLSRKQKVKTYIPRTFYGEERSFLFLILRTFYMMRRPIYSLRSCVPFGNEGSNLSVYPNDSQSRITSSLSIRFWCCPLSLPHPFVFDINYLTNSETHMFRLSILRSSWVTFVHVVWLHSI